MTSQHIDKKENDFLELSPELFNTSLKDHTLSTEDKQANIFWATDNYADRGAGYQYSDPITIEAIPLFDFSSKSDIDWSKSVEKIDQQLYNKYGLNDTEIAFIESMIKPT